MKYYIVIFTLLLVACKKDFLESKDTSNLNLQTYVNSFLTMEKYWDGTKILLRRDYIRTPVANYGDLIADDIKLDQINGNVLLAHYSWSQKANLDNGFAVADKSLGMNGEWRSSYLHVRSCSFVIEEIDKYRSENPDKSDHYKGQAYAFRAMLHFKLANIFSQAYSFTQDGSHLSIPYITNSDITVPYKRHTAFQVYEKIIEDLQMAIKLMKPGITNTREMNQDAAKAFLARVYLFKGDFSNSKRIALEVAASHPLMTIEQGYPVKMYYGLEPSQTESLFQLEPYSILSPVPISTKFTGALFQGSRVYYRPTLDIMNIIQENPNDVRNKWLTKSGNNWSVTKYPTKVTGIGAASADYYHTVFRSSEMFLIIAEAAFKTNDENTAREYLNKIRKRADPANSEILAAGAPLLDSIYKERRKELAFEGGRMFDLLRWHKGVERTDPAIPTAISLSYPSNKAIAPIPIQDVNIAGLEQNEDY